MFEGEIALKFGIDNSEELAMKSLAQQQTWVARPKSALFKNGLIAMSAVVLTSGFIELAQGACGQFEVVKGDVQVSKADAPNQSNGKKTQAAQTGQKVCAGDTVTSGPQSRAKIVMEDGNQLNISPDSQIKIEQYDFKPAENKKKVMLNVLYGKLRSATKKENMYNDFAKDGSSNTFQVKTKSAVAGVRGTDFLTSFDRRTSKSEIITFKGAVEVGQLGANGTIQNSVQVTAGQKTEARPGAPPLPPVTVPKKEFERMGSDTRAETASGPSDKKESTQAAAPAAPAGDSASSGSQAADEPSRGAEPSSNEAGAGKKQGPNRNSGGTTAAGAQNQPRGRSPSSSDSGRTESRTEARPQAPPSQQAQPRQQAPPAPSVGAGSMVDMADLGRAPASSAPGGMNTAAPQPPPTFIPPAVLQPGALPPPIPVCDFCNQQIQTGPARVNITISQ